LCKGRQEVRITDETKLPLDVVEVVMVSKANKAEIGRRIEAGQDVPGAALEYGRPYVRILGGRTQNNEEGEDA
jgi:hypothetical protein